ncbi:DNA mismatch repair protein [Alteromonas sp. 1_MG-2023]|uniref:helix-turn-helix domain-containing protein n=1 Tax=Alteromonas sp. 1_MG-2023 TaxID=3062669 RepID=UPI0026E42736|nr:DNA mismatch repair protein [Alteromonas sp. 1_MG-2023]MDO6565778.1 DNA mismatch repair protein [Alteromonas sp. 1_MG-2023]
MRTDMVYNYALYTALLFYFIVVARFVFYRHRIFQNRWLAAAILCWPVFMLDEWMRLWQLTQLAPLYGLSDVFAVLLMTCCYRVVKPMLLAYPSTRSRLWVPFWVAVIIQFTILLIPTADKLQWLDASPSGHPLLLWPAYLASLTTGFCVLLIGILITEHIQMYHRNLPEQVADVQEFRVPRLASVMANTVVVAFASILLVTAATFGFFIVPFWESLHHMALGVSLLVVLFGLTFPRVTSPSPLHYERLDEGAAKPAEMRAVIGQAKRAMIDGKNYKKIGLTLKDFSDEAGVDPTTLAIALHLELKKNFRGFVYQYRLDYAKNVLLRSDAKIAKVAKRLGLNSDKFMGDVLVKYLRNSQEPH